MTELLFESFGMVRRAFCSPLFFALVALWVLLGVAEYASPGFFRHDDNATWFTGAFAHDFRTLFHTGRLAEVNFFQYGGEPFLEQGQTAVLYPPIYLGVALAKIFSGNIGWCIEWIAALHLTLGLVGFHLWLRRSGVSPMVSALAALAWVLNPFVLIVGSSWIMVTFVAAWLPWTFWALDRALAVPSARASLWLGAITGIFFLQGYVQWIAYTFLFAGIYAAIRIGLEREAPRLPVVYYLAIAALVFFVIALPLLLPMIHAVGESAARAHPLSLAQALSYSIGPVDFLRAQIWQFRQNFVFGLDTAPFFCPALLFVPWALARFVGTDEKTRRSFFILLLLASLALILSTRFHAFLSILPLFERFRWPFKVFLFAQFFLIALAALTATHAKSGRPLFTCLLAGVVFLGGFLGFRQPHLDFFSKTTLPGTGPALPPGMDPSMGRVIAIDDHLPEESAALFFTHAYGTFYEVPCVGGYDPLVSRAALDFALGLDFPNVFSPQVTPASRARLDERAVRYWMVEPRQAADVEALGQFRRLAQDDRRVVLENLQALPIAAGCPIRYAGNSMRVDVRAAKSPLAVSVGPTDGWWYRVDGGPWKRGDYRDDRLRVAFDPGARTLEISYFDARFREGLWWSLEVGCITLGITLMGNRRRD